MLAAAGYDAVTVLRLALPDDAEIVPVAERPTRDQAQAALDVLWRPFAEFPWVDGLARAARLAALTAVVRPILPTSPAFGHDAPAVGSGKTLLARCVGALACGSAPAMLAVPTASTTTRKCASS
ncbi:MAG: hypothetical protein IT518_28965 [Burkholderiales bacterium]|nr:hypothetical protein [Burkholderiales bacterium]